jgi:hypothetical protein
MIPFAIGISAVLAMLQASIAGPREAYADCLHEAGVQATAQKMAPEQYSAFATGQCAAAAAKFKAALIAFDTKNGVKRARADSDAQLQLEDYVAMSAEKYAARAPKPKSVATPAPVAASAPVEPGKSN